MPKLILFLCLSLVSFSSFAKPFSEVLDEIYGDREYVGVDLTNADQTAHHFFYHYIQYKEEGSDEWRDWRNREEVYTLLELRLVGIDLYWSNHIPREGQETLVTMESFYITDFIVNGRTLTYHPIMMRETWLKGKVPDFMDMEVIWHKEMTLESRQRIQFDYKIGSKEFRVFFGYIAQDKD